MYYIVLPTPYAPTYCIQLPYETFNLYVYYK